MTEVLRTQEDRFLHLADFPFEAVYVDNMKHFEGLRMHYIDEGAREADHLFLWDLLSISRIYQPQAD